MSRIRAVLAAMFLGAGLLLPGAVSALTFSPPMFDLAADPGQTIQQTLKLRNESDMSVTLRPSTASFAGKEGDENVGVPDFYSSNEERDGRGLGAWISFDTEEVTLLPGEQLELPFAIAVPGDAGPGSYFGAVIIETSAGTASGSVGVLGTAAALVFVRVNGAVIEEMKLASFSSNRFTDSLSARFEAYVQNAGTVHLRPYGEIRVKNVFGQTVATLAVNRAEYKSVLPGMSRRYSANWQHRSLPEGAGILQRQWKNFAFGPYTAELTLRYGQDERTVTATTRFWAISWLALLLLMGGGVLLAWSLRRCLRWYADRVIRKHATPK